MSLNSPTPRSSNFWMRKALQCARRAWGNTAPNPMVGAVVVSKDGATLLGAGYHHQAGTPHAEVHALRAAGIHARGATLYVTLEPCSTYGRTPPCTEAILAAGIARVVIGTLDPNPRHAGRAVAILQNAGVAVETGIEEAACQELNKGFFRWITTKQPYVILKMAMTLDGKIATASGDAKWITGPAARQQVQKLRRYCDAILIGGATARLDHPSLTVRGGKPVLLHQPERYVFSRSLTQADLQQLLSPEGGEIHAVAPQTPSEWQELLQTMGQRNIMTLLIEGGGELAGIALQNGIVDEVEFHIAPKLLTGRNSRPVVGGENPVALAEALELQNVTLRHAGSDLIINGKLPQHATWQTQNCGKKLGDSPCLPD